MYCIHSDVITVILRLGFQQKTPDIQGLKDIKMSNLLSIDLSSPVSFTLKHLMNVNTNMNRKRLSQITGAFLTLV